MSAPGAGRARGRGSRGRGQPQQQPPPGLAQPAAPPSVQPGGLSQMQPNPEQPPMGAGAAARPAGRGRAGAPPRQEPPKEPTPPAGVQIGGGRGVHRGAGYERPSRTGSGEPPVEAMAGMTLQVPAASKRHGAAYEKYVEASYKESDKDPRGKTGDKVEISANHFKVSLPSEVKIWQYHVDFKPEVESIRLKYSLLSGLDMIIGTVKCFDGGILYLPKCLQNELTEGHATRKFDGAIIKIEIRRVAEVFTTSPQFAQIVNLLFKKTLAAMDMKRIREHYFNPTQSVKIAKHKLEVMPGFNTSILPYEMGSLLGVDIVHKILRIDTFLDCLYNLYYACEQNVNVFHAAAIKNFVGTIVMTRHNNKTYRVDDIDWEGRPTTFFEKGGEQITYQDYFKQRWNIDIKDPAQPLLITRPTEKDRRRGDNKNLFLLPELCTITGLSDDVRQDFNVMRDLAVHTRIGPQKRLETLEQFMAQMNVSDRVREILSPWRISIDQKTVKIPARQLPPENIIMKGTSGEIRKLTYNIKEADWGRNMRNARLLNPMILQHWNLIYPPRLSAAANELAQCLESVGSGMGMRISEPTRVELPNDRNESFLQGIRDNLRPNVQMVVIVAPNNKKDRYDAIKKSCCIDTPVPSQVVLAKTLSKTQGLKSVATKIAIQMNCKMGGEVWAVEIPISGLMVLGIDSYHDSAQKGKSVGALVGSLNKECTRYYSATEYHPSGRDELNSLTTLLGFALKKYHEVNGSLPQKLVFYRDGVGDGQLDFVFHHECEQVNAAFRSVGGEGYKPSYAYVIVKKRINTRLFAREQGSVVNPQSGTIVDSHITKPNWYDFFLISQSVRQGTVSPTSYNVIYDRTGLLADHMQRLTYKLTHLYFNWQGTIRVPAPCQYAHKLAFLQGQSLHRQFSALLADKLFYL